MIDHRQVAVAASLALHLAVMMTLLWPAASARSTDSNGGHVEVRLMRDDGRLRANGDTVAETSPEHLADGPPSATALSKCDGRIYTGIGVRAWANGTILEVASGGPADKVGLRGGDTLLNGEAVEPDQHRAGAQLALRFLRDEREMPPVIAVIEEICNEQARPPTRERRLMV